MPRISEMRCSAGNSAASLTMANGALKLCGFSTRSRNCWGSPLAASASGSSGCRCGTGQLGTGSVSPADLRSQPPPRAGREQRDPVDRWVGDLQKPAPEPGAVRGDPEPQPQRLPGAQRVHDAGLRGPPGDGRGPGQLIRGELVAGGDTA